MVEAETGIEVTSESEIEVNPEVKGETESEPKITSCLKQTGNNLVDIIAWVKDQGYCVVLHGQGSPVQVWYNGAEILADVKIIMVNVSSMPGLLDEGEWDWYLNEAGCTRHTHITLEDLLSHTVTHRLTLGY